MSEDCTLLVLAVMQQHGNATALPTVDALLAAGADVNACAANSTSCRTPLQCARSHELVLRLLAAKASANNAGATTFQKPIHCAAGSSDASAALSIAALLAANASVDEADSTGATPIMYAATSGSNYSASVVAALLAAKASANDMRPHYLGMDSLLVRAVRARGMQQAAVARLLVEAKANVNAPVSAAVGYWGRWVCLLYTSPSPRDRG